VINFCNPDSIDQRRLFELLARVIRLDQVEFASVYGDLRHSFDQKSASPFRDDYIRKPLALVNPDLLASASLHPGIDLPCWIEAPNSNQTIVLLGQDPLRDEGYFTAQAATQPYVVIGTPYSVHSRALRTWRNNPRYWAVISDLLGAGYNVYLTDLVKFWAAGQRAPRSSAADTYRTILRGELDLVSRSGRPVFVVAFGNSAAHALNTLLDTALLTDNRLTDSRAEVVSVGSTRVIRVLHPSPQNRPILPAYLAANDVDPAKGVAGLADVIKQAIGRFKPNR
jgi:hypothetical protein